MTEVHVSRETLETYARRELPLDELARVDSHVATCEACGHVLRGLMPDSSSLLETVRLERRRHLSFEEMESVVEGRSATDLDALARQHLSECDGCKQEIADLLVFDRVLSTPAPAVQPKRTVTSTRRPFWRLLLSPPSLVLAGGAAALLLVFVGPFQTRTPVPGTPGNPLQLAVRLEPPEPDTGGNRPRSFGPTAQGPQLSDTIDRSLEQARRLAATQGQPQTVRLTIARSEYDLFTRTVLGLGSIEPNLDGAPALADALATSTDTIEVLLTLLPPVAASGSGRDLPQKK